MRRNFPSSEKISFSNFCFSRLDFYCVFSHLSALAIRQRDIKSCALGRVGQVPWGTGIIFPLTKQTIDEWIDASSIVAINCSVANKANARIDGCCVCVCATIACAGLVHGAIMRIVPSFQSCDALCLADKEEERQGKSWRKLHSEFISLTWTLRCRIIDS